MTSLQTSKAKIAKIEYIQSSTFQSKAFAIDVNDSVIYCDVLKMKDSFFIWIGLSTNPSLDNLSIATQTRYEKDPIATKLIGDEDMYSMNMARRLSKKLKKIVYVSCNVVNEPMFPAASLIEKALFTKIKQEPDFFS